MKELLIKALTEVLEKVERRVPQTKNVVVYVDIEGVNPKDLYNYMITNNIPETACFGGKPNGYDSFDTVCLCYDVKQPTTDFEKLKFKKEQFNSICFKFVYDSLINNGYKRIPFNSELFREFKDITVYDMFQNKEYDRLEKYYLGFFKLT